MNLILGILPSMVARRFGRVIHISGGGATSPLYGMSSYAASKAAAVRLIETLALEYEGSGVTFNSIAPGMLKTKLLDQMLDAGPNRIGENLFKKSWYKADASSDSTDKALELMDFLTSNMSAGITGRLISAEWDNWTEYEAKGWGKKEKKNYSIVPTTCFNCESAFLLAVFPNFSSRILLNTCIKI